MYYLEYFTSPFAAPSQSPALFGMVELSGRMGWNGMEWNGVECSAGMMMNGCCVCTSGLAVWVAMILVCFNTTQRKCLFHATCVTPVKITGYVIIICQCV